MEVECYIFSNKNNYLFLGYIQDVKLHQQKDEEAKIIFVSYTLLIVVVAFLSISTKASKCIVFCTFS